jgi:putative DNA primase/helicase
MSSELIVECGPADEFGRRSVTATCGRVEHRDRFNTDDAFRRRQFAEATLTKFQWAITADVLAEIDELVVRESAARDARGAGDGLQPRVKRLADVPPSYVEWLWPGRVALGAVTMLAGDPGVGKSFVTLDMAARVSRGSPWPEAGPPSLGEQDKERAADAAPASVVLFSAEDDLAKTIRPRLEALGADCSRIEALEALEGRDQEGSYSRPFDMSRDLEHLTTVVERLGDCRLVVVDPISAFLGRVSENANAEVRSLLAPLAEFAAKYNLSVLAVSHLRKEDGGAIYRTMGSMAFVAAARASWIVVRDPEHAQRRLLLPVKNNLAEDAGGLAFTIEPFGPNGEPVVCWAAEPVWNSVDAAIKSPRRAAHRPDTERQQIVDWLRAFLADGPKPATDVREAAEAHGFNHTTLRRAFRTLEGQAIKSPGKEHGHWMWQLPQLATQDDQNMAPILMSALEGEDAQNRLATEINTLPRLEGHAS